MKTGGAFRRVIVWAGIVATVICAHPSASRAQETGLGAVAEASRLRNAGEFAEAIVLLKAHLRAYPSDGDAIRILAQTQYWAKDFAGARQTYERAVTLHPEDTTLRQQYSQFQSETASQRGWVKLSPVFRHDDQPLDVFEVQGEVGWYVSPPTSVALSVSGTRFSLSDSASRTTTAAEVALSHISAESGATIALSGGVLRRSFDASNEFIGSATASAKLSPAIQFRGSITRAGYFYTEASLSTPVMTNTGRVFLTLQSSRNFLGELSAQFQQYPDDNSMKTAYLWIMAPVLKSATSTLHIGYSGAFQDANELRYALEEPSQSASSASASYNFAGRYDPYYTPLDMQTHSIIAASAGGLGGPAIFRLNGGYAVLGSENAPHFGPVSLTGPPRTVVQLTTASRDIHPWNARATVEINGSGNSPFMLGAETARTAFYSTVAAFAFWTLKF